MLQRATAELPLRRERQGASNPHGNQADGAGYRNLLIDRKPAMLRESASDNPIGVATFPEAEVATLLAEYTLPANSPLSVLAVELLPAPVDSDLPDPLGSQLGLQRILRTSPLVKVAETC